MAYRRLGDILRASGLVTEEQLDAALEKGAAEKKRLGQVLIEQGIITEMQMIAALSKQLGVDYVDLSSMKLPMELASSIPKSIALKYSLVPIKLTGNDFYIAMEDPLNFRALEEVRRITKHHIVPVIATKDAILRAFGNLYGSEGVSRAIDEMKETLKIDENAVRTANLGDNEDAAPMVRLIDNIIERAVSDNASDIHIEPREVGLVVRMRIDGVLHNSLVVPKALQDGVITRIKVMGNMDIAERRIPLDGRATSWVNGKDIDLRISTLPTNYGEKVVIRLLVKSESLLSEEGIGLRGKHLAQYQALIRNTNGVVLISGPTGSGKSTTMSTMVSSLNTESVNLVTLEDPVEYDIDGVNQVQVNEKTGMTFASGLRSILRQDPDIIAVGEIRDGETAEIAMRAAITGHLVLSTIHTNSAPATLDRLEDIGVERYLIASAVKGIIAQRLVRKICKNCKESYEATDEELILLNIPRAGHEKRPLLYRGKGCPECHDTGYHGRTGVYEILTLNSEIKKALNDGKSRNEVQAAVAASGFEPMAVHCRELVLAGETSAAEAIRILHTTDS